jgi:hypothetical protein
MAIKAGPFSVENIKSPLSRIGILRPILNQLPYKASEMDAQSVWVMTGASGIGREIVRRFAANGALVSVIDRLSIGYR